MIIVKLMGGMGNQMFQYAFALSLALKNKTTLKLDLSFLQEKKQKTNFAFRDFDLTIFNLTETTLTKSQEVAYYTGVSADKGINLIARLKRKFHAPKHLIDYSLQYDPAYKQMTGNIFVEGYFQSPFYFSDIEDVIRKEFRFNSQILSVSQGLATKISTSNSVCLHVRRTDFIEQNSENNIHGFVGIEYYLRAVKLIKEKMNNPELFIFSDDIEWCKNNLVFDIPVNFVLSEHNGVKSGNYLQLMTLCKHFIIPNSTFSWWAAWLSLSPDKLVIAPLKWMASSAINEKGLIPDSWIRL